MTMFDLSPAPFVIDAGLALIDPYETACSLRTEAEAGCEPELYELAASAFFILDMYAAGNRLIQRANHYRDLLGPMERATDDFSGMIEYTHPRGRAIDFSATGE